MDWVRGFHDLRHFRATTWLANGAALHEVAEWLGHKDLSTTSRYVHYLQKHGMKAFEEAERLEILQVSGGGLLETESVTPVDESWNTLAIGKEKRQ